MLSKDESLKWLQQRTDEYRSSENDIGGVVEDFGDMGKPDSEFVLSDKLEEVEIGGEDVKQPTYLNINLTEGQKRKVLELLKEFTNCFGWCYTEMPGLSKELVEHRLPIKKGFKPYRQRQEFQPEHSHKVKEEVDRLLQAGFIRLCCYA
jgi:hypothetical protein